MTSRQGPEGPKYSAHGPEGHGDWSAQIKEKAKHAMDSATSNETVQKLAGWAMNDKLAAFLTVMIIVGLVLFPFYGALSGVFIGVALGMAYVDEITSMAKNFGRYYERTSLVKVAALGVAILFVLVELPTLMVTAAVVTIALNLIRGRGR